MDQGDSHSFFLEWDPADYLLDGHPTTPRQIRTVLEHACRLAGATDCVLVTISGEKLLRSVSFSTTYTARGRDLADALRYGASLASASEPVGKLSELDSDSLVTFLRSQPAIGSYFASDHPTSVVKPRRRRTSCFATVRLLIFDTEGPFSEDLLRLVDQLEMMVNTTANVDVAKDISLTTKVTHLGTRLPAVGRDLIAPTDVDKLFELVLSALSAEAIAMYERSPDGTTLRLVRATRSTLVNPTEGMLTADDMNVNSVAISQRRPVFLAPDQVGLSARRLGPKDLVSAWTAQPGVRATTELAVPVPSAPLGRLGPPYGVLSVCRVKTDTDSPQFNRYDLAVIRNLALRLGFIIHLNRLVHTQGELASLIRRRLDGTHTNLSFPTGGMFAATIGESSGIPADLNSARATLSELVQALSSATSAMSCTIRLLLPGDGVFRTKRTWSLVRFVASPEQRMMDSSPVLPLNSASVHAWVARTGSSCYLPDVRDNTFVKRYPGLSSSHKVRADTRAEVCFPVLVDGRLVGTLNLESSMVDAFAIHLGSLGGFAATAGQLIATVRRDIAERTLSFTSSVHNSSHDILRSLDAISRALELDPRSDITANVLEEITAIEHQLDSDADPMAAHRAGAEWPGSSIATVVDAVRQAIGLKYLSFAESSALQCLVDAQLVPNIRFALTDVLASVQRHMSRSRGDRAVVEAGERTLGGKSYVDLVVRYPTAAPVPSFLTENLYRVPLAADVSGVDRPHLGSYSAAAAVRSVGGELYFRVTGTSRVEIIASLPVLAGQLTS